MKTRLGIGLVVLTLTAGTAWAADVYVDDNFGNVCATATGAVGNPFCTVQEGVNAAIPPDRVFVAAGTYFETLNITTAGLEIIGASRATVIIDPTGMANNNAGIYVSANNVTLRSLTLRSTVTTSLPRYGVKFGAVDGCTLSDVTVQDVFRSGIDALGTSNLTISNVSSVGNGGHGLSLVDCNGVAVTDITLGSNGWQNVSVATWGRYSPLGTSGIVFSGTNSFGDLFQLEMGDFNNPGVPPAGAAIITYSTNILDGADVTVQASDFGFALHGEQDDSPGQARIWFFSILANASIVPPLAPIGHWTGNAMYIESLTDGTQLYATPGCSIQAAVDAADPGDTVNVAAGTYAEQVTIGKSLVLLGAGGGSSIIQAPGVMTADGNGFRNIITVSGAGVSADLSGLTIAGPGPAGCNSINSGVFVGGTAHADIHDNAIIDIRDEPFSGCQNGRGIWVGRQAVGEVATATITNNTLSGYQKTGIVIDNVGSSAVVTGNTITGVGPTATIAQNGLQFGRGAGGSAIGNNISGHAYTGPGGWWSGGLIVIATNNVTVSGNSVDMNDAGIFLVDIAGGDPVTGNVIELNNCDNNVNAGIYVRGSLTNGNIIRNNTANANWAGIWGSWAVSGNTYTGNTITNAPGNGLYFWMADNNVIEGNTITASISGFGDAWGIAFDGDATDGSDNNTVRRNTVTGGDVGVWVGNNAAGNLIEENFLTGNLYGVQVGTYGGLPAPTSTTIRANDLSGNTTAAVENTTTPVADASGNWYGSSNATAVAGQVTGSVDYTPWLAAGTDTDTVMSGFQGDFSTLWVDDDSPQAGATGRVQEGIGMVTASTVNLAPGTYEEQVVISMNNLNLIGSGSGSNPLVDSIIQSPVALTYFFTTGTNNNFPVVAVHDATGGSIQNLRVDGLGRANGNYRYQGIGFWNAGGDVSNCVITGIRETPFSGSQHGVGMYAFNDTGGPYAINVTNTEVIDYQKTAIALQGAGLTVNVSGCTTTGIGATPVTAQNGIQVALGAGGTINGCTVSGNVFTGGGWAATGILLYSAGTVAINATTVTDNTPGVYCQDTNAVIDGLTVSNADPDSWDGLYAFNSTGTPLAGGLAPRWTAAPFEDPARGGNTAESAIMTVAVTNSTFTGHGRADSWGVSAFASGADVVDLTVATSTVSDWDWGVVAYDYGGPAVLTANANCIHNNTTYGFYSNLPGTVQNAAMNWWGDPSGPGDPTGTNEAGNPPCFDPSTMSNIDGLGNGVTDLNVNYCPWVDVSASPCIVGCGNGLVETGEGCDDGNLTTGDGCDASCAVETGWGCTGEPSACSETCGDGLVVGAEDCDPPNGQCCSATCAFEIMGTNCGDAATLCSGQDTCDGAGTCNPNHDPTTVECRADAGECDVPDFCDGAGNCDADAFEPMNTNCGDGPTLCSGQDTCDGAGNCDPNHDPTTVECRADAGECDVADFCDGAGNCDANAYEPFGTSCGAGPTECSNQDTCDGAGGCTNANDVAAGTPCGSASDTDCDNPDSCDGTGGCLDNFESNATVCRASVDECDPEETCDGLGACPDDFIIKTAVDDDGCCPPGLTILSDNDCPDLSIPTVSQWGMITLSLLMLTGLVIQSGRRRNATA